MAGDGSETHGERTTSRHVAGNVIYTVKNFHFNSGDVRYASSVDKDRYLAAGAPGWGRR
jgi:hypothetical protein